MKIKTYIILASTLYLGSASFLAQIANANEHKDITPQELNWVEGPNSLPPGAKMVVLEGDPSQPGPFTIRIKTPANYKIPAHWHPTIEHVTVLQGTFNMGHGDKLDETKGKQLPSGSFSVVPAKSHHFAWNGDEEVILQLHGVGPWGITYINQDDDPRKVKKNNSK